MSPSSRTFPSFEKQGMAEIALLYDEKIEASRCVTLKPFSARSIAGSSSSETLLVPHCWAASSMPLTKPGTQMLPWGTATPDGEES